MPSMQVHTWELLDKAFAFPRIRHYEDVENNLDLLQHFQDNFNTNQSNEANLENFLRVANTVKANFAAKYTDGKGYKDPAN